VLGKPRRPGSNFNSGLVEERDTSNGASQDLGRDKGRQIRENRRFEFRFKLRDMMYVNGEISGRVVESREEIMMD